MLDIGCWMQGRRGECLELSTGKSVVGDWLSGEETGKSC